MPASNKASFPRKKTGKIIVIIPAYNEGRVLEKKIDNTLLCLPEGAEVVIVSDGSTDQTNKIAKKYSLQSLNIHFFINESRGGKNECINLAIKNMNPSPNDILIFTDCNTFFEPTSIPALLTDLKNGAALVGGSMVYKNMATGSAKSEGLYWKYEEWIRKNESKIGKLIVCNGGIFAMWAEYFELLPPFVPNDFEAPLRLCGIGNRVVFNRNAVGLEEAISSRDEEWTRKKRMANRQMNCIRYLWHRLNIKTKFQVFFHKIARWFGFHLFIASTLIAVILYIAHGGFFVTVLTSIHIAIVILIFFSVANKYLKIDRWILPKVYHATGVHIYSANGAMQALKGVKTSIWEKASTNR